MNRRWLVVALALLAPVAAGAGFASDDWLSASAQSDQTAVPQGGKLRVAVTIELDKGYHVNANPPSSKDLIPVVLTPQPADGIQWGQVQYPRGKPYAPSWAEGAAIVVYSDRAVIRVDAAVKDEAPVGDVTLHLGLAYQGCSEDACYPPASRDLQVKVSILPKGAAAVTTHASDFAETEPPEGRPPQEAIHFEGQSDLEGLLARSPLLYFAFLFIGGLLLNLTPCVFPLVPVTMSIFAQQGDRRTSRILSLAGLYVLGLATTFAAVGVIAALTGQSLGLVLQQPAGVLAVVIILAVMMASMFGAFEIQLPSGLMGKLGARKGLLGAVFMGAVMGAIAAPCVGPFLIALITFVAKTAASERTSTAFALLFGAASFFVTGLGLGAPYLLLGLFTGLISRYPRSGGWLVWVKKLMGFALAGLILYYVQPYIQAEFFWLLVLTVAVLAAVYVGVLEGLSRRPLARWFWALRLATAAAVLAGGIGLYTWATAPRPEVEWSPWSPGALEAAKAEGKPAIVYFGADWCIACKEWHAGVFSDPDVVRQAKSFQRILVDLTQRPEGARRNFAERFQAINPPVVIVLDWRGEVLKAYRNPPKTSDFLHAMEGAAKPQTP